MEIRVLLLKLEEKFVSMFRSGSVPKIDLSQYQSTEDRLYPFFHNSSYKLVKRSQSHSSVVPGCT